MEARNPFHQLVLVLGCGILGCAASASAPAQRPPTNAPAQSISIERVTARVAIVDSAAAGPNAPTPSRKAEAIRARAAQPKLRRIAEAGEVPIDQAYLIVDFQ